MFSVVYKGMLTYIVVIVYQKTRSDDLHSPTRFLNVIAQTGLLQYQFRYLRVYIVI